MSVTATRRMRLLPVSATKNAPSGPTANPAGLLRRASTAEPPSPRKSGTPSPAIVVMMPVAASTRRRRWLSWSAINKDRPRWSPTARPDLVAVRLEVGPRLRDAHTADLRAPLATDRGTPRRLGCFPHPGRRSFERSSVRQVLKNCVGGNGQITAAKRGRLHSGGCSSRNRHSRVASASI